MDLNQHSGFLLTYKQWIEIGIIIVLTFILTRVLRFLVNRFVKRSSAILNIDKTRYRFFANALNGAIYVLGAILIIHTIPGLRGISTTLFASAGILAAVIGFASQQAMSNIIGGVFVVVFRPFRVGDHIMIGNEATGVVEDITLRHTIIRNNENARIIIPNSIVNSQTVINYDILDAHFHKRIIYNITLDNDVDLAIKILRESIYSHPNLLKSKYHSADHIPVDIVTLSDKFVTLRAYAWTASNDKASALGYDLNKIIYHAFRQHNIHLSEPQTLIIRNNENTL